MPFLLEDVIYLVEHVRTNHRNLVDDDGMHEVPTDRLPLYRTVFRIVSVDFERRMYRRSACVDGRDSRRSRDDHVPVLIPAPFDELLHGPSLSRSRLSGKEDVLSSLEDFKGFGLGYLDHLNSSLSKVGEVFLSYLEAISKHFFKVSSSNFHS